MLTPNSFRKIDYFSYNITSITCQLLTLCLIALPVAMDGPCHWIGTWRSECHERQIRHRLVPDLGRDDLVLATLLVLDQHLPLLRRDHLDRVHEPVTELWWKNGFASHFIKAFNYYLLFYLALRLLNGTLRWIVTSSSANLTRTPSHCRKNPDLNQSPQDGNIH